jgi:hypothetical protein
LSALSAKSWSDVQPHFRFLKEILQQRKKAEIEAMCGTEVPLSRIDPFMINEAVEYLNLSMINLLAYKRLVCGKYLAWGKVTLYYSQFYALNCLLRLRRYALVHVDFVDEERSLMVRIFKPRNSTNYRIEKCTTGGHENTWDMFAQKYPELVSKNKETAKSLGKFSIRERENWNYNLFYASQSSDKYALDEAEDRCRHNFLDPNYGLSASSEEAAEYFGELMANIGWEEAGTGDYQKYAIKNLIEIGKNSKYGNWYSGHLSVILESVQVVESSKEMKDEMTKWLRDAISQIQKGETIQ